MVVAAPKMTVDAFFQLHGEESRVDLVRGVVTRFPMPGADHGYVCVNAAVELKTFAQANKLGRVMGNDTFIRLAADTARGADVCFLSYAQLPADRRLPKGMLEVMPELVVEVRSPSDLWTEVFGKVSDYIGAGVTAVVVLDPQTETASVYRAGTTQETFAKDQTLTVEDVLPGFAVPVARFFAE